VRRWTKGVTYIRQGGHHVGHWPTFLVGVGYMCCIASLPSVLWVGFTALTLLVRHQEEHPVRKNWVMSVWLSAWWEMQMICIWSSWCHCHPIISCFIKIQTDLTLLGPAQHGCPGKEVIKRWVSYMCYVAYLAFFQLLHFFTGCSRDLPRKCPRSTECKMPIHPPIQHCQISIDDGRPRCKKTLTKISTFLPFWPFLQSS